MGTHEWPDELSPVPRPVNEPAGKAISFQLAGPVGFAITVQKFKTKTPGFPVGPFAASAP